MLQGSNILKISGKKPKRLGKPLNWDETQLEQMAQVSESDKQMAAVLWKENAPSQFKGLLEAKVMETDGSND